MSEPLNFRKMTKKQQEILARRFGWTGDFARTSQAEFIAFLEDTQRTFGEPYFSSEGAAALRLFVSSPSAPAPAPAPAQQPSTPNPNPNPNPIPQQTTTEDPATMTTPAAAPAAQDPAAAMAQLQMLLSTLLGAPKLDMAEVEKSISDKVAAAVAAMEPRRVYVTPTNEWTPPAGEHVHRVFEEVIRLASIPGQNIMLVGPAGCGKTQLAFQIASALGRPFASISCSGGMSESQVAGWLLPVGESGRFVYVTSDFVRMYEEGGVFLFDELDASDENMVVFLNQALANGGFYLPQRIGATYVKRHERFVCIAAANTFGHGADRVYAGRNKLDGATLDRFRSGMVEMDYDQKLEEQLCHPEVLGFVRTVRAAVAHHKLRRIASTRIAVDFSKQLAAGFSLSSCKDRYFSDWTADEKAKVAA